MATQPVETELQTPTVEGATNENDAASFYADDQQQGEGQEGGDQSSEAEQQEAAPAVEAPNSWPAEDREVFKTLTPEAQAVVARREAERDKQVYAKGQEVRQVEATAREAVMKIQHNYATQISSLLGGSQAPERPDPRLLATGQEQHRALFYQQEAEYRSWESQQQTLQTHLGQIQQQAAALEAQHFEAQKAHDESLLAQELGDIWSEPSKRQKFLSDLEPIGGELGYSRELMAQANATDILALKKALDWKAKAARWDDLQKRKMTDVRAGKQPPKVMQPGVSGSAGQQNLSVAETLYPNDVRR